MQEPELRVIKGGKPAPEAGGHRLYRRSMSAEERTRLAEVREAAGVEAEIEAMQVLLMRLLAEEEPKVLDVTRLVLAVAKLKEVHRKLTAEQGKADALMEMIQEVLEGMELGEGGG